MDKPWLVHGESMVGPWSVQDGSMVVPWRVHGKSMVAHGGSMDGLWWSMDSACYLRRGSMAGPLRIHCAVLRLWWFMMSSWTIHGRSMDNTQTVHGESI